MTIAMSPSNRSSSSWISAVSGAPSAVATSAQLPVVKNHVVMGTVLGQRVAGHGRRTYDTYMPNKTISVPDDVVPIIDSLDVPFSRWVTDQLRRHAAQSTLPFAEQLLADASLASGERLTEKEAQAAGERMDRSAPW